MVDGQTSLTDVAHWRQFCTDAAADLTLLDRDPDGILSATLEGLEFTKARYERVTNRLVAAFGDLDGLRVLELGAGYGGQALSILRRHPDMQYYLTDLPEPLSLQLAFLAGLPAEEWRGNDIDVFVSSFALSELRRELQLEWLELASTVPRGFLYWNGWLADQVSLGETLGMLPESTVIEACPDRELNWKLLWGI